MTEHRKLTIKNVYPHANSISVDFHDSVIGFQWGKKWLETKGIDPQEIVPGKVVFIKGRNGNNDMSLWGLGTLQDLTLTPTE